MKGWSSMYHFVYADEDGNGYIDESHYALGLLGNSFVEPAEEELIPLPEGASLTMIPDRQAVVMTKEGQFIPYKGKGWVMGALLPQGFTRTLLPRFSISRTRRAAAFRLRGGLRQGRRAVCGGAAYG